MKNNFKKNISISKFFFQEESKAQKVPLAFDLEITNRCNNNCRHCYINLPAQDKIAQASELSVSQIDNLAKEAAALGVLWCLITGGEPLLREDFFDIYLKLKEKGFLVSVFTNATLITPEHIRFFKKYPPRDIEVTVYGVTPQTYEAVSRKPGSYAAFMNGLELLLNSGIEVRLKAMALRSNVQELPQIIEFCRKKTKDYFRFDPFLHARFDRNAQRNTEIEKERLRPQEIVAIERADNERFGLMKKNCNRLIVSDYNHINCNHLFHCGTGLSGFSISSNGVFRLCSSLWHPDCVENLENKSLKEVLSRLVPQVREMCSNKKEFLEKCRRCELINLCLWCPAHAYLETGELDNPVEYFCQVAHSRQEALIKNKKIK